MNQYAIRFQEHWEQHRPSELAEMNDPEAFFADLGQQAAERIEQQTQALETQQAAETPPGNSFLAKLGQLTNARATAESTVLAEMLPPPEDQETDPDSDPTS